MKPLGPLLELGLVLLGDRGGRSDSNCPMPLEHGASHERATTIAHDPVGTLLRCPLADSQFRGRTTARKDQRRLTFAMNILRVSSWAIELQNRAGPMLIR
jgi:hypothetical protein